MVAKAEDGGRGVDWEFGTIRYKLLHKDWINNKVLLYSTGSYIQYPVKTIVEKNLRLPWINLCTLNSGGMGSIPGH